MWDAINDGTIYSCPSLLASFAIICFADLKRYRFTYLFAFPALHSDPAWRLVTGTNSQQNGGEDEAPSEDLVIHMTGQETAALVDCVQTWRYRVDSRQHGFFIAKKQRKDAFAAHADPKKSDEEMNSTEEDSAQRPTTPWAPDDTLDFAWSVGTLAEYEEGFFDGTAQDDQYICFADPSTFANYPGWMLRNLLVLIRRRWKLDRVRILCYRDVQARRDDAKSFTLPLELGKSHTASSSLLDSSSSSTRMPKVTGWERNNAGKVTSRVANLGEYMDPHRYVVSNACT